MDEQAPLPTGPELTPEQLDLVTRLVLRSWKFWSVLLLLVAVAAWSVIAIANRVIEARSKEYLNTFGQQATNQIGAAFGQISNQIVSEFRQPKIKAAIEQVARDKAGDLFESGVRPAVDAFQSALDMANSRLARSSNLVAQLESDALAAERRIPPATPPPVQPPVTPTNSVAVIQPSAPVVPIAPNPPEPAVPTVKLVLVNRSLIPAGNNYLLTLFFKIGTGPTSGTVDMVAGTFKQTAKIVSFAPMTSGVVVPPVYSGSQDAAELKFAVSDREPPTVVLELSAPTIVRVISDSFDSDLTIPVAADKLPLPSSAK